MGAEELGSCVWPTLCVWWTVRRFRWRGLSAYTVHERPRRPVSAFTSYIAPGAGYKTATWQSYEGIIWGMSVIVKIGRLAFGIVFTGNILFLDDRLIVVMMCILCRHNLWNEHDTVQVCLRCQETNVLKVDKLQITWDS